MAPPLAELLSTKRRTRRLWSSRIHCQRTNTIARSSIWQISCSPTWSFHKSNRLWCTSSCTTNLEPVDSSKSTAPKPPTPFSQAPSVKTSTVFVLMATGTVLGWTLWSKTRTSSHHFINGLDWDLPFSTRPKILKQAYLKDLPEKYPVAKFKRPWSSWASDRLMLPASWIPKIFEEILSIISPQNQDQLRLIQHWWWKFQMLNGYPYNCILNYMAYRCDVR